MVRAAAIFGLCCSAAALAQSNPDDEWGSFPLEWNEPPSTPPAWSLPPPVMQPPPVPPTPRDAPDDAPRANLGYFSRLSSEPNKVSIFAAPTLGQWNRGQGIFLGFPLVGLRLAIGVLDRLDLSLGFQSFYGVMNELQLGLKVGILQLAHWAISLSADGLAAGFAQRSSREGRGPRWFTGHRNFGLCPGLIVSYQRGGPRSARLFLDARYLLSFDTEQVSKQPLGGVPPPLVLGHNALTHFGAELPLTPKTSFVFLFGLDLHGRSDDARVMPVAGLGLVTGI